MMTTGSVRGKCDARQSGQRRTQPADATRVGDPHWAQKRCRVCQSISERASARIAASPVGIVGARVRTSISSVSMSGAVLAPLASIAKCARPSSSMPSRIRMAPASICPRHEAAGCQSSAGFCRAAHERLQVAQGEEPRPGVRQQRGDPLVVIPAGADPVERIAGKAVDVFHMGGDYTASWLR